MDEMSPSARFNLSLWPVAPLWLKVKNPASGREAEEDWAR
jgi:hypothetical protein